MLRPGCLVLKFDAKRYQDEDHAGRARAERFAEGGRGACSLCSPDGCRAASSDARAPRHGFFRRAAHNVSARAAQPASAALGWRTGRAGARCREAGRCGGRSRPSGAPHAQDGAPARAAEELAARSAPPGATPEGNDAPTSDPPRQRACLLSRSRGPRVCRGRRVCALRQRRAGAQHPERPGGGQGRRRDGAAGAQGLHRCRCCLPAVHRMQGEVDCMLTHQRACRART